MEFVIRSKFFEEFVFRALPDGCFWMGWIDRELDVHMTYHDLLLCLIILYCRHLIFRMVLILNFVLVIGLERFVFYSKHYKKKCIGSVNSFDARSRHFTDFLHLYKFSSFHFLKNILKFYSFSHKDMFCQNVMQEGFLYFLFIDAV